MNLKKFLGSPEIGAVHTKLTILDVFEGVMGRCFSDFFLLALPVDEGTGRHELKLERRARSQFITSVRRAAAAASDADAGPEQGAAAVKAAAAAMTDVSSSSSSALCIACRPA